MKKAYHRLKGGTLSRRTRFFVSLVITIVILLLFAAIALVDYVPYKNSNHELSWPHQLDDFAGMVNQIDRLDRTERLQSTKQDGVVRRSLDFTTIADIVQRLRGEGKNLTRDLPLQQFSKLTHLKLPSRELEPSDKKISIVIVVKSAVNYFHKRDAIRRSWFLKRTIGPFQFETYFMVGACDKLNPVPSQLPAEWSPLECENRLQHEDSEHKDLIQSSGVDSYYNNTIKTVMMLKWAVERHPSDFVLGIDDDYAFEYDRFLHFLKSLAIDRYSMEEQSDLSQTLFAQLKQLSREDLYAGYVIKRPLPRRVRYDKWHVSRAEYPYNRFPSFVTGGLVLLSQKTARQFYIATYFKESFKFDDVYLGILAHELGVKSVHTDKFMCSPDEYLPSGNHIINPEQCVGVHDIDRQVLIDLWAHRLNVTERAS